MKQRLMVIIAASLLPGCGMLGVPTLPAWVPEWVPLVGKSSRDTRPSALPRAAEPRPPRVEPSAVATLPPDESVTDRVVAVVNNDAITLGELQESIVAYRQENRQAPITDEQMAKEFLARLIDARLQLQEADREKIVVDDAEVEEELADRIKRLSGNATREDFEAALKAQGLTMETVKKRVRESLRLAKVVRRKVTLRVSVNDQEIDRYLEENRPKLETGLAYRAHHILIVPDETGAPDAAWENARIRAELLRTQILGGTDFAELAREHSADATARDGGDLGALKRGELAAEVEAEILKLQPGEVSLPYRSSLGYHLFRLDSTESLEGEGMMRARQQIRDILFREKYEARLDSWLKEVKQRAIIEVRL